MSDKTTLSLSVLSGKGGAGKSNLALNLALALASKKKQTLLIDCDLGLANLDVLLGLAPSANIQNLARPEVRAEDLLIRVPPGLLLLPANSGLLNQSVDNALPSMLADKLDPLARRQDFVILDVGAGIAAPVLSFGAMTMMRLLVLTPEPTSLTDCYALIKVLSAKYGIKDYFVLVNQAASAKEGEQSFQRLREACSRFLDLSPTLIGHVRNDPKVTEAVRRQKPALTEFPSSKFSGDIMEVAEKILNLRRNLPPGMASRPPLFLADKK
ncbi:MAG: P-loop NTPase [Desulfovibrionaceae bacterium]|nr:P-loop NTPase [Desulfovibrionaceae bacterium]